jgi:fructose-1,6-bisphosphatase/inositol monophosphatase family enzyme
MVASGYIDLVVEADLKAYDVGGLIPLVEEAGGVMTTWSGGRPEMGGTIVAAVQHGFMKRCWTCSTGTDGGRCV